jgi:hypothetical protein
LHGNAELLLRRIHPFEVRQQKSPAASLPHDHPIAAGVEFTGVMNPLGWREYIH